jgi:hypothetical protein
MGLEAGCAYQRNGLASVIEREFRGGAEVKDCRRVDVAEVMVTG